MTWVAVPYQLFQLTHSTLYVGLLYLTTLVPLLVAPIVGGAVADAVDRRRLLLFSEVGFALVPEDQLVAANALESLYGNFAAVAGPAAGGLIIAGVGLTGTYLIDVASFGASLASIWLLPPLPASPEADRPSLGSIIDGFRFVRSQSVVLGIFLVDTNAMIFGMPMALFPAIGAHFGGGSKTVGFLYAAPYAGALLASIFSGPLARVRRQGLGVIIAAAAWGAALVAFGFATALWLALLMLAVAGAADFVSAVLRSTIVLVATPDALRGRITGIEFTQVAAAPTLGNVEAGVLASLTSIRFSIVSGGLACIAGCGVLALAIPALLRYDAKAGSP